MLDRCDQQTPARKKQQQPGGIAHLGEAARQKQQCVMAKPGAAFQSRDASFNCAAQINP
ncbi:hypothetical protein D3C76_1851210 [compost metagenome]